MKRRTLNDKKTVWSYLINTYGQKCVYCNNNIATCIDHVIPYSFSGYHGIANLRPCCVWCNLHLSNKVFEAFEDKYSYAKELYRNKKHIDMLTCSNCLFPFYSALQKNCFLCNYCHEKEYGKTTCNALNWDNWLKDLAKANIDYKAHFKLSDYLYNLGRSIPKKDKIELLQKFSEQTLGQILEYVF